MTRRDATPRRDQAGFTLLEVLVALAISAMLIAITVQLYRTVLQAGETVKSGQSSWVAEQFLRGQAYTADSALGSHFNLVHATTESYSFVTHKSVQYGENGPPVFVTYRYDPTAGALVYDEVPMPGWWRAQPGDYRFTYDDLRVATGELVWHGSLFANLTGVQFSYWDEEHKKWLSSLIGSANMPPAVKVTLEGLTTREIVLENGVSSLSSSSGSSPPAPSSSGS
jgi:prepilin-type N-terminal cleavage/methylation domain-containing protein